MKFDISTTLLCFSSPLLYLNDLLRVLRRADCTPYAFADDCNEIVEADSRQELASKASSVAEASADWLAENKLALSIEKTAVLEFATRGAQNQSIQVQLHEHLLENVACAGFLGVILDSHLTWAPHTTKVCLKLGKSCFALKQLRRILTKEDLREAYMAL